ncbi:MAG: ATP synthase F1 subunit gamma [Bacteroidia bacterium]
MSAGALKELRQRIKSVRSIQQTTRAMQMISAVKLRRAADQIQRYRPYRAAMEEVLVHLLNSLEADQLPSLARPRSQGKVLAVVMTASRGLCGAFNSNLIRFTVQQLSNFSGEVICLGKKGVEPLRRQKWAVSLDDIFSGKTWDRQHLRACIQSWMEGFQAGEYAQVEIFYNRFKSLGSYVPTRLQLLPIALPQKAAGRHWTLFEPVPELFVEEFLPQYVVALAEGAALENVAAEHAARMVAMQNATDNAQELLDSLRLSYNKARQAAITKELLEIVSGAEALKG